MSKHRQNLGKWGERKAASYLQNHGYIILDQNVRTGYGEIDIVSIYGEMVVFIEVKTRESLVYGPPEVSVDERKSTKLIQSAMAYIQQHPNLENNWRIDVISIQKFTHGHEEITHFKNAISE